MNYRLELSHLVLLCAAAPICLPFHTLHHSWLANDTARTNFIRVSFQLQSWPDLFGERESKISCFHHFRFLMVIAYLFAFG